MPKYRKKPVVIDAVRFDEDNEAEALEFINEFSVPFEITDAWTMVIHTLEGDMTVSKGDFLIRGVQGEFYPCKPDIFVSTYEKV